MNTRLKAMRESIENYLRQNYLTKTDDELGSELGINGPSVRKRLKKLGLRRRTFKKTIEDVPYNFCFGWLDFYHAAVVSIVSD